MNQTILLIDDEISILEPLSMLLEYEGFNVVSLINGEETIEKIIELKPDLVLLDILMSGSDGREICKFIKTNAQLKNVPVILMSAHPNAKVDAQKAGADGFVAKPFETEALLEEISRFI